MHRLPSPAFHFLRGLTRVFVPALVVPENPPCRIGHPRELWDGIGKGAETIFGLRNRLTGATLGEDVPEITDNTVATLGKGDAVDLPLIELAHLAVTALLDPFGNHI